MTTPKIQAFDSKCLDLAEHFLGDEDDADDHDYDARDLAQAIQNAVEGWFERWSYADSLAAKRSNK